MKFFFRFWVFILACITTLSCHYRLYNATDPNGKKHKIRGYKSYKLEHRYYDRLTVKYHYKPQSYNIDTQCLARTDTSIDCDSIKIYVLKDSWQYATIFTRGIVPCKLLSSSYGLVSEIPGVEQVQENELRDITLKNLVIYDVHQLTNIHNKRGHRFYRFNVIPYWFYIELTNKKAKKKSKSKDFIMGSHLTWMYKSKVVDI